MAEQNISEAFQERKSYRPLSKEEPHVMYWKDKSSYDSALVLRYLTPLREAKQTSGAIPASLQTAVLNDLHWYFTEDLRERAPTVIVNETMAVVFHERMREIMAYIDHDVIASLDSAFMSLEVRHALFSYKAPTCHSVVVIDAYDHDQHLVRLSYFVHGTPPTETFLIDGQSVKPAHSKYRGCRFFRRMLFRQRIAWIPVTSESKEIRVLLDNQPVQLSIGTHSFIPEQKTKQSLIFQPLQAVKAAFPTGKGLRQALPSGLKGLKIRFLRWVAQLPPVRKKLEQSWVFLDRLNEADDNAEHFYRWVRQHHPEVNAWFLLDRSSTDWSRLNKEGFRLIHPSWLSKLLILNSSHIISSQPEYLYGGFDPRYYADLMNWRFSYLRHGVTSNDQSHWLNEKPIDLFVTSSLPEYMSISGDDTPYTHTTREVFLTGLTRHDSLLSNEKNGEFKQSDTILIMPTWRGVLSNSKSEFDIADSEYVQHWGSLLRSNELLQLLTRYKKRLAFMPHTNAVPYLKHFKIAPEVQVYTKADIRIQDLFSRSVAMVTDYSSVAFEMALLRKSVFYYQFDKEGFYSGDHNLREGYFDYGRDGFGPVAFDEVTLISHIAKFLQDNAQPTNEYLDRMRSTLPLVDGHACSRVYEAIASLKKPSRFPA